jgi:hypothetical protein
VNVLPAVETQLQWLESIYKNAGHDVPVETLISEKALLMKISRDKLKMMQKYLVRQGKLAFFASEYIHSSILDKCRFILLNELKNKENGINEKEFRLLIDGTKRFVQLILGILIEEEVVWKRTFFILITDKGKQLIEK